MSEYYTIFDRDNNRIGFAKAQHENNEVFYYYDTNKFYVDELYVSVDNTPIW